MAERLWSKVFMLFFLVLQTLFWNKWPNRSMPLYPAFFLLRLPDFNPLCLFFSSGNPQLLHLWIFLVFKVNPSVFFPVCICLCPLFESRSLKLRIFSPPQPPEWPSTGMFSSDSFSFSFWHIWIPFSFHFHVCFLVFVWPFCFNVLLIAVVPANKLILKSF